MSKLAKYTLLTILFSLAFSDTQGQIDSLKKLLQDETNEKQQISRLTEIADIYIMIDSDSAMYYCDTALELILNRKDCIDQQIRVLTLKSELYCQNGDFDKAMHYAESAKELLERTDNKSLTAYVKLSFANIYTVLSFYDLAFQQCMSALDIVESQNDLKGQRKCLIYLGSLSVGFAKYYDAVHYFKKALSIARQINDKLLLGCSYNNLGIAYACLKDNAQALIYFNCSLKIAEQHNLDILLIYNYLNFATYYKESREFQRSEEYCNKAIPLIHKNKNLRMLCMATNILAENMLEKGDYKKGIQFALKGDSISKQMNLISEQARSSNILSDLYVNINKNDSALKYYKIYSTCKDSLYSRQNQINMQRIKFEYQIKEEQAVQKQKSIRIRIFVALLILGLFTIIIRYFLLTKKNRRKLKKIESDLNIKKREITSKLMYIQKKNEAIASVADKLEESRHLFSGQSSPVIANIIRELSMNSQNDSWEEFELRFREVDPAFFRKLSEKFPHLTPNDKKLCAYLKLNLSTKEIASLLNLSLNSVLSARYRLRKKLNINKADININQYLDTL